MIEQLMDPERSYGEPEYSKMSRQINNLKQKMMEQLDQEGRELLEELSDSYIHQGNVMIRDAFVDGFCTAIGLVLESQQRKVP